MAGPVNRARCWRIGLTGGIGSGKSTVARMLAGLGATIIDADHIARQLTAPGGAAIAAIAQQFGPQAIATDGAMDRAYMRDQAFGNPAIRQQLEAIIHPLVGKETARQAAQALAQGAGLLVHDIPLLVESPHWRRQLDAVVVVDCQEATQIERVAARSQLSAEAVRRIVATQASRRLRRACADVVLYNDGLDLEALQGQVLQVVHRFGL